MKNHRRPRAISILILAATSVACFGAEILERISVAPTNDLAALILTRPEQGSLVRTRWSSFSKSYREGWCLGATNRIVGGYRNILAIEDGHTKHAATDAATGYPIIVLTDAKPTNELKDLVQGYNAAMSQVRNIPENAEQSACTQPSVAKAPSGE